eukprot:scaffold731_cov261-Pinguiococcus_pyrenoidosus.AAC.108
MIIFSLAAASLIINSDALEYRDGCTDLETYLGYGAGISYFLVFWILAQLGIIIFPCCLLGEEAPAPTQAPQDKFSSADQKFETEAAP